MEDKDQIISKVKSLIWCTLHQSEKVPGHVNNLVDQVYPHLTDDIRYEISQQLISKLTSK